MSRKIVSEAFTTKPSRNDRFAQMSRQEQVIEQKKREIQARLQQQQQQKEKTTTTSSTSSSSSTPSSKPAVTAVVETKKSSKPIWKGNLGNKPTQNANNKSSSLGQFNMFSNDGSFLDQFKQMADTGTKKSFDPKITITSIKSDKVREPGDRTYSDERNKPSRWSKSRNQPFTLLVEDLPLLNKKVSRFSDRPPPAEAVQLQPPPSIVTSFASTFAAGDIFTNNFTIHPPLAPPPAAAPGLPPPPIVSGAAAQLSSFSTSTAPPPLVPPPPLILPPPQIVVSANSVGALIAPPPPHTSCAGAAMAGGGGISVPPPVLAVPPPPCGLELTAAAPTPIPVHTIPPPEPINTHTIPPPAPLQLQNIPSPSPIRLNEIPNPKPIDLLNIPAPGDEPNKLNKTMPDPDFIKNVPPPNKSVPPPNIGPVSVTELPNVTIPPPTANPGVVPPPTSVPPPTLPHLQLGPLQTSNAHAQQQQQQQQQQLICPVSSASIPSLMAQPVLPPPGMTRTGPPPPTINVSQALVTILPPVVNVTALPGPPPVLNQPPPLAATNQIPPMNFPPPIGPPPTVHVTVNTAPPTGIDVNTVCPLGSASHDAMMSLGRMVAQCGSGIEDIVHQRSVQDPSLWFLFHKNSAAYQQYRQLVEQYRAELGGPGAASNNNTGGSSVKPQQQQQQQEQSVQQEYQPEDIYEPDNLTDDEMCDSKNNITGADQKDFDTCSESARKRKRKSRWGEKVLDSAPPPQLVEPPPPARRHAAGAGTPMLSKLTRNDPGLRQYAANTFGSTNLTEEDWRKAEDHYKINLLYQEMVRKRQELEKLERAGKNKYEYDSDEDIDGGTWEHKLRMQEMEATQLWANELTRQAEGKHHIGDFLPPDELKKFMEKYSAAKEGRQPNLSDYKEFKLKEDNIGFKMLQKLGWQEGQGLGSEGTGIVEPINKGQLRDQNQGLGAQEPGGLGTNDDEYDAYRKRMMLAYRFRPNPLNNPRRPYY